MRRALIYLVVALIVGGAVGTLMARDPGYVLVSYENMSLETSLWFAVLASIVGYVLLRIVIGLLLRLIRSGAGVAAWQQNRRARVAQARTVRGLLLAGEGDWAGARKALAADAESVDLPLVNYLGAARAANEIGDAADRDALLQMANESTPGATLAVGLTRAELQIAARQYADAAQTLTSLKAASPNQPRVLRMLAECLEGLGDWAALLALAPELQKRNAIAAEPLRIAMRRWSIEWFEAATGAQSLIAQWNALDKDLRADPAVVAAYVHALEKAGAGEEAEATSEQSAEAGLERRTRGAVRSVANGRSRSTPRHGRRLAQDAPQRPNSAAGARADRARRQRLEQRARILRSELEAAAQRRDLRRTGTTVSRDGRTAARSRAVCAIARNGWAVAEIAAAADDPGRYRDA